MHSPPIGLIVNKLKTIHKLALILFFKLLRQYLKTAKPTDIL
jgi:hypothetical protein